MADSLEMQYENELTFIRQLGKEFARDRPKIADRLLFDRESGASEDPHVERLIEAFAFLTARIRLKLEDEFPELTESLLETLYPHYLAPIPSLAIAEFQVDPQRGNLPDGHLIERGSRLRSREAQGVSCQYRTTTPVTLWPIEVADARYQIAPFGKNIVPPSRSGQAKALLRIELAAAPGASFAELNLESLRFFLNGDYPLVNRLYELIFNHVTEVVIRSGGATVASPSVVLPATCLRQVGFGRDEGLLPYGGRSFLGYRLLTEYFAFPHKFMFVDLSGLGAARRLAATNHVEILLFLNRSIPNLEPLVRAETFRLGCAPIVNLFDQAADPIHLSKTQTECHVIPDVRYHWAMEVYSIDSAQTTDPETQQTVDYRPFYAFKHGADPHANTTYWCQSRRPSVRKDDAGTEVYLSLVDLEFNPSLPAAEVLMLKTTCSNRDLPGQIRALGSDEWEFQLDGQAPCRKIVSRVAPTASVRLPQEQLRWRLLSHLALNHLSITDAEEGAEALREILKIYDYAATRSSQQHIEGIASVTSRRVVAPITDSTGQGFCRAVELTIDFDEDKFVGTGPFLFACVLEQFLGLYASLNSATRLVARLKQREGIWKRWPFRSGEKTLL
ncbi:MAG TPA: type VI secretion system baseplate subunit TssF [Pirellulales bacterium]|nr:type VI secretion system baseplate subunit TssF [Pirellulales bacterium]